MAVYERAIWCVMSRVLAMDMWLGRDDLSYICNLYEKRMTFSLSAREPAHCRKKGEGGRVRLQGAEPTAVRPMGFGRNHQRLGIADGAPAGATKGVGNLGSGQSRGLHLF